MLQIFFGMLANRLPENIHLIVSGRNAFLSGKEILRLGKKLYQIHTRDLCLNRRELSVYTQSLRCQPERRSAEHASLFQ